MVSQDTGGAVFLIHGAVSNTLRYMHLSQERIIHMVEQYKILWEGGTGELVEKKSRFVARTEPVESEEAALAFIEKMRKEYWDARHHCSAYVIGDRNQCTRCNDDGEPSQTAGRPMLDVLLGEEIHNICVVVIRYFGGTLLGTGGLVRAYSGAVQEGLKNSKIVEKCLGKRMKIRTDYTGIGKIQYILGQNQIAVIDSQYTELVEITAMVPFREIERLSAEVIEGTNGKAKIELGDNEYYGLIDGKVTFL